jgi:hypothetical protein
MQNLDKEKDKEFQIFVNTKPRKVTGPTISFERVLQEGGFNPTDQEHKL